MDLSKIFLKDACPTSVGGQAVMEGLMMKGPERTAVAIRLPNDRIHLRTTPNRRPSRLAKLPLLRGVYSFATAMIDGTKILLYAANVLEANMDDEGETEEPGRFEKWLGNKFGERAMWNIMIYFSVFIALVFSVGFFILLPTALVGWLKAFTDNRFILSLCEGLVRLVLFIGYIWLISKTKDIKTVFQYHGAEHKTIHCFEKNLPLTPENAQSFYTLHPRCGTSFLMFVMIITILLFPLLGWPSLAMRVLSRIIVIPVIAGLSFELLKWAGRSDSVIVKILSMPGLYLQKLTTKEPTLKQLEVAIVAMEAVLVPPEAPMFEGVYDREIDSQEIYSREMDDQKMDNREIDNREIDNQEIYNRERTL